MKKHKKKIIFTIIVLFFTWFAWQRYNSANDNSDIDSYTINRGDVIETVSASGELVPVDYANLSFVMPALVEWIGADIGDTVKKDQELIKLDRDSIIADIHSARIDVDKAVSIETQARRKWDKYKPEERDRIKKDVEQARTRLYGMQSQLTKTVVVSPIDGIVTQKNVRVGEIAGGMVMRIIDESDMEIEILMSETDAAKMQKGQSAFAVFDAYSDEKFDVNISSIDPEAVNIQDVTYYKITFVLAEDVDKNVLSGMSIDVDVVVNQKDNVLTVPLRFVRHDDSGEYVYVEEVNEEEYKKQYITTGIESDDGDVEVLTGLNEGEIVYAIYEDEE